ncbi:hypothetical protein FRC04_006444 [Tulasnella sp. 424]|nr:hypothetical protein FRC04_006444 [Tulasnella sp. 424]KAG8980489.1 hypothetical protein FRC05_006122 [Tulasnella sp. 425]
MTAPSSHAWVSAARVADTMHVSSRVRSLVRRVWTPVTGYASIKVGAMRSAERAVRNQVVDLVEGKRLRELDPESEEFDDLIITLTCGHALTVKTLDGICELEKYYTRDNDAWTSIASPPEGFQRPPACPHCREPIKSLRYGRVYKRVDVDISEQNVATRCRWALGLVRENVATFDSGKAAQDLEMALENAGSIELPVDSEGAIKDRQQRAIGPDEPLPVPSKRFGHKSHYLEQIPAPIKDPWIKAIRRLIAYYLEAAKVARATSSHFQAYEAAVATLHQEYLTELGHPDDLPETVTPEDMALGLARTRCGIPAPPKANVRFRVEACWMTFNIRFQLASFAQEVAEIFVKAEVPKRIQSVWADMIEDILHTVERDALKAIHVARGSQSHRQILRTVLFLLEAQYQTFSHRVDRCLDSTRPQSLNDEARRGCAEAKATMAKYAQQFRDAMDSRPANQQWLEANYITPAESIVAKWAAMETRLEEGSPNNQARDAEKGQVVKALMEGCFGTSKLTTEMLEATI